MLSFIIRLAVTISELNDSTEKLAEALYKISPEYLNRETAKLHAEAAKLAESSRVSAELLLGMAFFESRYISTATSRVERGKRIGGVPKWDYPPKHTRGPYFCGVTQADARNSWRRCLELRNINIAYKQTVHELEKWLAMCKNNLYCALNGYGGGFPLIRLGSNYPGRVIYRARLLKQAQHDYENRKKNVLAQI